MSKSAAVENKYPMGADTRDNHQSDYHHFHIKQDNVDSTRNIIINSQNNATTPSTSNSSSHSDDEEVQENNIEEDHTLLPGESPSDAATNVIHIKKLNLEINQEKEKNRVHGLESENKFPDSNDDALINEHLGNVEMPQSQALQLEDFDKRFYFDIGTNPRGTYMRISEVTSTYRASVTVPHEAWQSMRDIIDSYLSQAPEPIGGDTYMPVRGRGRGRAHRGRGVNLRGRGDNIRGINISMPGMAYYDPYMMQHVPYGISTPVSPLTSASVPSHHQAVSQQQQSPIFIRNTPVYNPAQRGFLPNQFSNSQFESRFPSQ